MCIRDSFMGAHAIHLVKHSVRLAVQVALNSQCGKLVGYNAQIPSGGVWTRVLARTVSQYLRRRCALISGAKWTESAFQDDALAGKISGTLGAVSGNDHPASGNGVFSQFRHKHYLTTAAAFAALRGSGTV